MFFLRLSPLFFISKQLKQKIQTSEIDLESDSYTLVFMLVARLRVDSFATYACSCRIFFIVFLIGLKNNTKIPAGKYESHTRMLQMNPP